MNKLCCLIILFLSCGVCEAQNLADCKISLFDYNTKAYVNHFDSIVFVSKIFTKLVFTDSAFTEDKKSFLLKKIPFGRYDINVYIFGYKDFHAQSQSVINNISNVNFTIEQEKVDERMVFPGGQDSLDCFIKKNVIPSFYSLSRTRKIYCGVEVDTLGVAKAIFQNEGKKDTIAIMNEWIRVVNLMPRWTPSKIKGRAIKQGVIFSLLISKKECK